MLIEFDDDLPEDNPWHPRESNHNPKQPEYRRVGVIIPIIDGKIYLAQRGSDPYKGMWGAIGGKHEPNEPLPPDRSVQIVIKQPNRPVISLIDKIMLSEDQESLTETSIREFFEEMFHGKKYPEDVSPTDLTDIHRIGTVEDTLPGDPKITLLYLHLAKCNRKDFTPSPREITAFKPLSEINAKDILIVTRIGLMHIKRLFEYNLAQQMEGYAPYIDMHLEKSIPEYTIEERRVTDMAATFLPRP